MNFLLLLFENICRESDEKVIALRSYLEFFFLYVTSGRSAGAGGHGMSEQEGNNR